MKWINAFCLICIFLCATFFNKEKVFAQDSELQQGDSLFAQGNFFEAAIAYERVYFLSPSAEERVVANLRKAAALKQQGEFVRVVSDLQRSLPHAGNESTQIEIIYEMALSAFLSGSYSLAHSLVSQLDYQFPQAGLYKDLPLLKGMLMIKMQRWTELALYADELALQRQPSPERDIFVAKLKELLLEENQPVQRDPEKGRLYSTFMPGAGQIYSGSTGQGLLNGFSQLASLGVAVAMGINQLYFSGVIIGLGAFQSFYFGGVKQASNLTVENNLKRMIRFQQELETILLEIYQLPLF